ncbi:MAG: hypothetical protein ABSA52_20055 [Candidatus Binatia bacterium]|jgi:hypothetical protein
MNYEKFKKHWKGFVYLLGFYVFVILLFWQGNPEKTVAETLVFAIELPFVILYSLFVEGIPHAITEIAQFARYMVVGLLWLGYIGAGAFVFLWLIRRLIRISK